MRRGAVVGVVVGAVIVAGLAAAVGLSLGGEREPVVAVTPSSSAAPPAVSGPTAEASATPDATTEPAPAPGAYVDFSEEALAAARGTRVLFFHAPWCPQCRALEADILASGVPEGITVLKVDYDTNQNLRQQYGVTLQTTVVALDESGGGAASFVAYDEPTLHAALAGLGLGG